MTLLSEEILSTKTASYKKKTILPNVEVLKESWTEVPCGTTEAVTNFLWQMLCNESCFSDLFRILLQSVLQQCSSAGKLLRWMMTQRTMK